MGYLRDRVSEFSKNNFNFIYNQLFQIRQYWWIKRQQIFKYTFNPKRYPGFFVENNAAVFPDIASKVDRVIYCFWTGNNELSSNRKKGIESLKKHSGVKVILVTPANLNDFILEEHPLHPAYHNLSLVHKSDYLRCYFMHFHGGGYADVKTNLNDWNESFGKIQNQAEMYLLGYTELNPYSMGKGQGIITKDQQYYYRLCVGTGGFICRSNTSFTTEWYTELLRRMDINQEELEKYPGDIKGRNKGYPIKLLGILSQIFAPLCLKYNDKIIHDDTVLPVLTDYQ